MRSADVSVRRLWTTMATTTATTTRTAATIPPSTARRRRAAAARAAASAASRCSIRRRAAVRFFDALPGTRHLLVLDGEPAARARTGTSATGPARGRPPAGRCRAGSRSGTRSPRRRPRPPSPKQPQSICSPRAQAEATAARKTTRRTADAMAAVRTKTPASSASPTAISTTGSPKATGRHEVLGQQAVGADGADRGRRVGHLEQPRPRRRHRRGGAGPPSPATASGHASRPARPHGRAVGPGSSGEAAGSSL